jgi:hypothetical protein
MEINGLTVDGQIIFAFGFAFIALAVAVGAVAFALWYVSDQQEL